MWHNFTFVENDTTHQFKWNPTSVRFGTKEKTVLTPLDGPPIIHYQDTTEVLGQLIWENVPVKWRTPYTSIEGLVGKSGVIYTNKMPQLVGVKNLMLHSQLKNMLTGTDYWRVGCLGTYHEDSSVLGPDGIHLAYLNKNDSGSTNAGCYVPSTIPAIISEHNVLSCYVKYGGSDEVGINIYQTGRSQSHSASFTFSGGGSVLTPYNTITVNNAGAEAVPYTDDWFRIWLYLDGHNAYAGDAVGELCQIYLYPASGWTSSEVIGTYMTDVQLEQGVLKPTWFAQTQGDSIVEPLQVEFLNMQTEYTNLPGVVKHNIILNFKLIGGWL